MSDWKQTIFFYHGNRQSWFWGKRGDMTSWLYSLLIALWRRSSARKNKRDDKRSHCLTNRLRHLWWLYQYQDMLAQTSEVFIEAGVCPREFQTSSILPLSLYYSHFSLEMLSPNKYCWPTNADHRCTIYHSTCTMSFMMQPYPLLASPSHHRQDIWTFNASCDTTLNDWHIGGMQVFLLPFLGISF